MSWVHLLTCTYIVGLYIFINYTEFGLLYPFIFYISFFILVFGDFNIHLDKPYAANFHSLLKSFDLKCLTTTSTHKSGSQLDLIYTRNYVADNVLVKPLHTSDHYFITFNLHLATSEPPTPLPVTFRRNLHSLSPSHLSSVVSSSLPLPTHFSALDVNAATDTFCSTLNSCSISEVSKRLFSSHPTTCPLDPIPSQLLQAISPTLLPALKHIIN